MHTVVPVPAPSTSLPAGLVPAYASVMAIDVVLSGFEPFGGDDSNPSWEAVRSAAPVLRERGIQVVEVELPVEFDRAGDMLDAVVQKHRPRMVIATGLAAGRTVVTPERIAINVRDARIADNAGAQPIDEPVVAGGPVGYFSTLPLKAMVSALREELQVAAAVSQTAGTFVCNDVFYRLQHLLASDEGLAGVRGGFVHVPAADDMAVADVGPALVRLVEVGLETRADLRISGGTEN